MDKVLIECRGGRGGNGCISFERLSPTKRRPTGGSGGFGGNVYLVTDKSLTSFAFETFHFNAGDGNHGSSNGKTGRNGRDVYLKVPCGTVVKERLIEHHQVRKRDSLWVCYDLLQAMSSEEELDFVFSEDTDVDSGNDEVSEDALDYPEPSQAEQEQCKTVDLDAEDEVLLVCEGGRPGVGNAAMEGTRSNRRRSMPETRILGQAGQRRSLLLELKLIADVGLVGFPNVNCLQYTVHYWRDRGSV